MSVRQLLDAAPADTVLRRLDARTKMALAAMLCLTSILLDTPLTLFGLLLCLLGLHLWARTTAIKWAALMCMMLAGIWGSVVSQAFFYAQEPRTPVVCVLTADESRLLWRDGVFLYKEGMIHGALQAMRSSIMLTTGMLLCWTTDTRELTRSLLYWRMPYPLAFMTIASLRFLPDIASETATVITAQRLRGFQPVKSLRPGKVAALFYRILFPVLARTIRRAATLSLSVEARGFSRAGARGFTLPPWRGRIGVAGVWGAVGALAAAKAVYWLQFGGIWYSPALRPVYDFVKNWL